MGGLTAAARKLAGSLLFRAVITTALLVLVFSQLDWGTIADKVRTGEPLYGMLAVLSVFAALVVGAARWRALLQAADIHLPTRDLFRIYAITSFANAFLPTSVGGDVARPLMVSRRGPVLVRAITTVLLERIVALFALVGLAWVGAALVPESVSGASRTALVVVSAGMLVGTAALVLRPALVRRGATALLPARAEPHLGEAAAVVRQLLRSPQLIVTVLIQSVAFQVLVTMQIVFLARMISVDLPFGLAAVALALVTLAMLIPISIGGFGVREGSYVVILAAGGIGHTDAVLISLLSVLALFIATLPGAIELVRSGMAPAVEEAPR